MNHPAGTCKIVCINAIFGKTNPKEGPTSGALGLIQSTVADIKAMRSEYIVPTHCTGFRAMTAFSREMPNEFVLNTAGTKYTFGA